MRYMIIIVVVVVIRISSPTLELSIAITLLCYAGRIGCAVIGHCSYPKELSNNAERYHMVILHPTSFWASHAVVKEMTIS